MRDENHFSIVGTGAVGGYYGGLLQKAGFDVHFLLNSDYDHVRKHGLAIDSPNGNFELAPVNAYDDPRNMPRCDVVVVALKTTANAVLPSILPHLAKDDGIVLTLQNGLGSEEEIAEIVGPDKVIGGLCFLCSNKVAPGHIRHLDYGLITLGEYRKDGSAGGITPRLEKLGGNLQAAGIPIRLVDDLALARWKKLVWNIPFNGLSVVRNELTNELIANPETRALCETLMNEVAAGAKACARPIDPAFMEKMIADTERMEPYAPSMKLDFDRGNPMEIESIYGNPIRAARAADVAMPETEKLYRQLLASHLAI
ncbi:Putative 2-dehydropantoate 2-reductase [Pontiella desulfatans]|uniref:2-dehydropantoate 2-reductase n=1 Tax=Pontiella desulfatans TaxID=2750659 RepID=A0A6C2U154_PONDE|nr:putative 2-dehydropantoate 2-reductase [Pontiella desulfatans]VGO13708.1 Putative 2-dehydropantoate 2-reductase [Pontiella desulfatans]